VALDRTVGLDTAYKALSVYFKRYEYQVVTSADMEKTFEEVSGKDLSMLFNKWVTGKYQAPTPTPRPIVRQAQQNVMSSL
jgi:aminopeptidase N